MHEVTSPQVTATHDPAHPRALMYPHAPAHTLAPTRTGAQARVRTPPTLGRVDIPSRIRTRPSATPASSPVDRCRLTGVRRAPELEEACAAARLHPCNCGPQCACASVQSVDPCPKRVSIQRCHLYPFSGWMWPNSLPFESSPGRIGADERSQQLYRRRKLHQRGGLSHAGCAAVSFACDM